MKTILILIFLSFQGCAQTAMIVGGGLKGMSDGVKNTPQPQPVNLIKDRTHCTSDGMGGMYCD